MNIYDLISRAQKLRKETQLDSVSPDRVGGLHEDTLKYINEFQLLASSPSLHKIYASVSAMQSDKSPKSDLTGKPLKPGQLVVIVPANQTDATAGDVYRYDGPSGNTSAWTFVAKIGAVPADAELSATSTNPPQNKVVTEKLTELKSDLIDVVGGEKYIDMTGQPGRISGSSGSVIEDSYYTHTNPFFVKAGSVVNFSVACLASGSALSETDAEGSSYIVLIKGISASEVKDFSYTAPRDMYLSITYRNNLSASGKVIVNGDASTLGTILGKLDSVEETLEINRILSESENWQKLFINSEGHCSISTNTLCTKRKNLIGKNTYLHVKVDSGYKYRILFFESIGTGIIGENTTYTLIPGEYDDIKVWHIDERLLSLPIGATCFTINIRKIDDSAIEVSDCEHLYVYNTYGVENISTFYNLLKKENKNILSNDIGYLTSKVITHNGITYTFNGFSWSVTGQATITSWAAIAGAPNRIPQGIDTGKLVMVKYSGTNVALHIVQYDSNGSVIQSQFIYNDSSVSINAQTKGIEIRLRVAQDAIVNEEVNPVIINFLDNDDLSKELYNVVQQDVNERNDRIIQCAKSYYNVTRANRFVYGKRSALYYPNYDPEYNQGDDTDINQVHCGALTYLIAAGCPYYSSRYVNPKGVNASYAAGYGFDFEAYSLKLAHAGNENEIAFIGADNINKTTEELKELMLFKTSYKLATSCLRWNMLIYIQNGESVDTSKMKVGDMVFYGHPDDGQPKYIDGVLQTPILIEGYRIAHCDTVVEIIDGTPYVIDAGAAPISFHPFSKGNFEYVCIGRVPLFDF